MGLFSKKQKTPHSAANSDAASLAQRSLDFITEGVLLVDERGMIRFANPASATMTGYGSPENITGLDYRLVIHLQTSEQVPVPIEQSELYTALATNQAMRTRQYLLASTQGDQRVAVELTCIPTGSAHSDRIITFRDITQELAEEHEQTEFISTASHEMRTPVASIEGYLGLALNPQTATIDERARKYLESAHAASQHLGHLFRDLLDVTKLDDKRLKMRLIPVDAVEAVKRIVSEHEKEIQAKQLRYSFGSATAPTDKKRIAQKVYMAVDYDFLHEILDNLVGNAIKYTPEGGEIWVNARGDGDKVLINVTDTGIGISPDDINHIFQKFYRVDNSQTRQIGGTGLGLYLVKQRVDAMGGRVWAESSFGDGSTFFVSLPRLSESEYEKMRIAYENEQMVKAFAESEAQKAAAQEMQNIVMVAQAGVALGQSAPVAPTAGVTTAQGPAQPMATGAAPVANTTPVAPAATIVKHASAPATATVAPATVAPTMTPAQSTSVPASEQNISTAPTQGVTVNPTVSPNVNQNKE